MKHPFLYCLMPEIENDPQRRAVVVFSDPSFEVAEDDFGVEDIKIALSELGMGIESSELFWRESIDVFEDKDIYLFNTYEEALRFVQKWWAEQTF